VSDAWLERLEELREEIRRHAGSRAHADWNLLGYMRNAVFVGNYRVLETHLRLDGAPADLHAELVQNVRPPTVREAYTAELLRKLHNYVAANGSLVDQSRRIARRYEGTDFHHEYQSRVDELRSEPEPGVVLGLRNLVLHRSLPAPGYRWSFGRDQPSDLLVTIEASELLLWDGWTRADREYLNAHLDEGVPLLALVERQHDLVAPIAGWMLDQFGRLHGHEIEEVNRLTDQYNQTLRGGP
jgi:hypothetical protein